MTFERSVKNPISRLTVKNTSDMLKEYVKSGNDVFAGKTENAVITKKRGIKWEQKNLHHY